MTADPAELADRAAGCLVGLAYGDALGVPYEFGSHGLGPAEPPRMLGGGRADIGPGEWTDDTAMAICIARAALQADLRTEAGLHAAAAQFEDWFAGRPADAGVQTSRVLRDAEVLDGAPADRLRAAAAALHERTGRSAGNGALMRTAPVAIALGGDADAIVQVARSVAELTHADPLAGDACVLWCLAIDAALRGEQVRLAGYVDALPVPRAAQWASWIADAEGADPAAFVPNGYTVAALQAAWAAVTSTPDGAGFHGAVHAAVRAGGDTDTVAAIAGALAGSVTGYAGVHDENVALLNGWPGYRARDLAELAHRLIR